MPTPFPKNRLWLGQGLSEARFGPDGASIFYIRTADGRAQLIRQQLDSGLAEIITTDPQPRGNVGYGGGAYALHGDRVVYAGSGQLITIDLGTGEQRAITPSYEGLAAPQISPCGRYVACVIEQDGHAEVLVVDIAGEQLPIKVSQRPDFAANPTWAPDGTRLAWIEWQAGTMPWDESGLRFARFGQALSAAEYTAALLPVATELLSRPGTSFGSPQWSRDGARFAYTSDESGWRSLYIADRDGRNGRRIDTGTGEIGQPDWQQGVFAVRWDAAGDLYMVRRYRSTATLLRVSPNGTVRELPSERTTFGDIAPHPTEVGVLLYGATASTEPPALITRRNDTETVRVSSAVGLLDRASLAPSEILEWPTRDGTPIYGVLHRARKGDGPRPLLVWIHGGPTSEVPRGWDAQAQYWASEGWHVLSVNHRGGTGSGRAYQDLLNGQWGVVDVEDARSGAEHVINLGLADAARVAIGGGSAGGFTTLMALSHDPAFWTAGVSLYGVGDLYELRLGSHRFEARYEDALIGPLPETAARWVERSALTHVHRVRAPLLLFHGKEDKAVPFAQSVDFAEATTKRGGIAELVLYDDEGHGFRREANRRDYVEKMEAFLEKYVINLQGRRERVAVDA